MDYIAFIDWRVRNPKMTRTSRESSRTVFFSDALISKLMVQSGVTSANRRLAVDVRPDIGGNWRTDSSRVQFILNSKRQINNWLVKQSRALAEIVSHHWRAETLDNGQFALVFRSKSRRI